MVQRKWAAQKPGRKRLVWRGRAAHVWRMNFPQFWAKGVSGGVACWRWSSRSVAEAQALATQAAGQLAERIRALDFSSSSASGGGYYPNRAMREPILQEFRGGAGEIAAVVTRNAYGCRVLNTARVMFVDIDLREPEHHRGLISRLLGIPPLIMPPPDREFEVTLTRIEAWTQEHPEWGWRIYRTRAGLRLLATQGLVAAESAEADRVFAALGADPLYRKLCQTQKCFRARLTPKPWRCGLDRPPARWPWQTPKIEQRFNQWEAHYQAESAKWSTCEFIRAVGNSSVHPEVQGMVKLHDEATRAGVKLRLA